MKKKILIIDSANLYHHQKYDWINNRFDNIVEPFLQEIQKLIPIHNPDLIVLANDEHKSRYRSDLVKNYKENRAKAQKKFTNRQIEAEDLVRAIKKNLKLFEGLFIYGGIDFVEADDVIGILYNDTRLSNYEIIVISQDKDLSTVINQHHIYDWKKARFKNSEDINGFTRNQWLMFQALMGDSVDSFSGVKGVGKLTAEKLVRRYKDINTLLKNCYQDSLSETDRFVKKALERLSFPEGREEFKLGYALAKIMRDTSLLNDTEKGQYENIVQKILNYKKPDRESLVSNDLDEFFMENKAFEAEQIIKDIGDWIL